MFNDRIYINNSNPRSYRPSTPVLGRKSHLKSPGGSTERLNSQSFSRGKDGIFRPSSIFSVATEIDFDTSRRIPHRTSSPLSISNPRLATRSPARFRESSIPRNFSQDRHTTSSSFRKSDFYTNFNENLNRLSSKSTLGTSPQYSSYGSRFNLNSTYTPTYSTYRFTAHYYAPKVRDRPLLSNLNQKFGSHKQQSSVGSSRNPSVSSTSSSQHNSVSSSNDVIKTGLERNKFLIKFREHNVEKDSLKRRQSISWDIPEAFNGTLADIRNAAKTETIFENEEVTSPPPVLVDQNNNNLSRWNGSLALNVESENDKILKPVKESVENVSMPNQIEISTAESVHEVSKSQSKEIKVTPKSDTDGKVKKKKKKVESNSVTNETVINDSENKLTPVDKLSRQASKEETVEKVRSKSPQPKAKDRVDKEPSESKPSKSKEAKVVPVENLKLKPQEELETRSKSLSPKSPQTKKAVKSPSGDNFKVKTEESSVPKSSPKTKDVPKVEKLKLKPQDESEVRKSPAPKSPVAKSKEATKEPDTLKIKTTIEKKIEEPSVPKKTNEKVAVVEKLKLKPQDEPEARPKSLKSPSPKSLLPKTKEPIKSPSADNLRLKTEEPGVPRSPKTKETLKVENLKLKPKQEEPSESQTKSPKSSKTVINKDAKTEKVAKVEKLKLKPNEPSELQVKSPKSPKSPKTKETEKLKPKTPEDESKSPKSPLSPKEPPKIQIDQPKPTKSKPKPLKSDVVKDSLSVEVKSSQPKTPLQKKNVMKVLTKPAKSKLERTQLVISQASAATVVLMKPQECAALKSKKKKKDVGEEIPKKAMKKVKKAATEEITLPPNELSRQKKEPKRIRFREYTIDDFVFLTVLGRGSFGKVLLAELRDHDCFFAVKCLKKQTVIEDDDVESIMIERKVLAFGSPNAFICKLFCTFQTESHLFFAMEWCSGGDLMFHVQKETRFTEDKARFYTCEMLCALWFLHKRSIIYRDLKLDNVMIYQDGHIRLVDFGMCQGKMYRDELLPSNFCGTPEYMAPEIIKGVKYNHSVDYWALGIVIYEMCVGTSPFQGSDEDELLWNVCHQEVHYPKYLSLELLKKNPTDRLGMATCTAGIITNQNWLYGVNWNLVEKCKVKPPFIPELNHDADVCYFDEYFTNEKPCLTPNKKPISEKDQALFEGFNYTNHNMTQ